jgi:predicted DNA-binding ribbon-helix-helix protein
MSPVLKRSIIIAGHKTSISLEDEFWNSFKEIASERGMIVAAMIGAIDAVANMPIYRQQFDFSCLAPIATKSQVGASIEHRDFQSWRCTVLVPARRRSSHSCWRTDRSRRKVQDAKDCRDV